MTDTPAPAPSDRASTQALISYAILTIFALTVSAVFWLIFKRIEPSSVMIGVLGGLIGVETTAVSGVIGYWIGASSGGKTANAALAQLAGAGPPPPAEPKPV